VNKADGLKAEETLPFVLILPIVAVLELERQYIGRKAAIVFKPLASKITVQRQFFPAHRQTFPTCRHTSSSELCIQRTFVCIIVISSSGTLSA
jgi:hypothetical protein